MISSFGADYASGFVLIDGSPGVAGASFLGCFGFLSDISGCYYDCENWYEVGILEPGGPDPGADRYSSNPDAG